jgi:hypothetical protein
MPRGGVLENRDICSAIIKQEPEFNIESSPQILNLSSIYRQPLSATKDTQLSQTYYQGSTYCRFIVYIIYIHRYTSFLTEAALINQGRICLRPDLHKAE